MRPLRAAVSLLCIVIATSLSAQQAFVPGRVLVKLKDSNTDPSQFAARHSDLGLANARALFHSPSANQHASANVDPLRRWAVIDVRDHGADIAALAARLRALPDVEWAEPDYIAHVLDAKAEAKPLRSLKPQTNLTVNDPRLGDQWALTYVHAPEAWDLSTGSASQVIAIIDTGIDLDHPDLASKIYVNPRESVGDANGDGCPGICGVDDDGDGFVDEGNKDDDDENGYVDDLKGWNFVANTNNAQDDNGHGTHAAGIAAAATNNGVGIAGACPLCTLMPLKAFDASGSGASSNIASAVTYAWRNGATILSMSFEQTTDAQVMRDALFAAYNGDARSPGVVLVAAAGNRRSSKTTAYCTAAATDLPVSPSYPAAYPFVIGVEANDNAGVIASFSNCQYTVRAPGVGIVSTYWNDTYLSMSGTSMACPLVAGIAGLVRAHNPTWTPGQVFTQIQQAGGDAYQALTIGPQPRMQFVSYRIVDDCPSCNNDGLIQPGETIKIIATVHNAGANALSVSGTLSTSDAAVTLTQPSTTWGSVGPNNDDDDADNPLQITISPSVINNQQLAVTLTVTVSNGDGQSGFAQPITLTATNAVLKSGIISADETWTSDHLYVVTGNLRVDTAATLTINAGTRVQVNAGVVIDVRGTLIARGTSNSRIVFTNNGGGFWQGLIWSGTTSPTFDGSGNYVAGSVLEYCTVEKSIGAINNPTAYVASCIIRDTANASNISTPGNTRIEKNLITAGVFTCNFCGAVNLNGNRPLVFSDNTIAGNFDPAIVVNDVSATTITGNSILGGDSYSMMVGGTTNCDASQNYWGTTDTSSIDSSIYDFSDDGARGVALYNPVLAAPSADAPAVVTGVALSPASPVGAQRVTFTVTFSRAMDMSTTPVLTFGPQQPYNQKRATLNAQWIDPTHWSVDYSINKTTGDGNQKISITGASDSLGFPLPDPDHRFGFEIRTSGTSSAQLTANGIAGEIDLNWTAADPSIYPTLAGYNIYRSDTPTGPFTRLNGALIADITYNDTSALPGVPYYYVYRIVDSDNGESANSDVASAAALDNVPPVITHTPITNATAGQILTIQASITDNIAVTAARVYYRALGSANAYTQLSMINSSGSNWAVNIPDTAMVAPGIEYYIEATDGVTTVQHGTPGSPHQVTVLDRPSVTSLDVTHGSSAGNTLVTITGSNFQGGATVTFGESAATNVVVNSAQSITCRTPPHYPQIVNVTVTNPNSATGTLNRGYTFDGSASILQLPTMTSDKTTTANISVSTPGVDGAVAATLEFTYDASVLTFQSVAMGSLTGAWSIQSNTSTAGTVRLSLAGSAPVTGSGTLVTINFTVTGNPAAVSPLTWTQYSINDGLIPVSNAVNGQLTVNNSFQVAGAVSYYNAARAVSGVAMTLAGGSSYSQATAADGTFAIQNVPSDNYVLTPTKSDGVIAGSISALDASLALQHDAHIITLSANQQAAADVNASGSVTSVDASLILQYVAGLVTLPFQGNSRIWTFAPATRSYAPLQSNQSAQSFSAILVGDPTGNWNAGGAGIVARPAFETQSTSAVSVTAATVVTCSGSANVPVGISSIANGTNVHAIEMILSYDSSKMSAGSVTLDTLANGWMLAANTSQAGVIRIAMAGATPITTTGSLLQLAFNSVASPGSAVTITSVSIDEGTITSDFTSGAVVTCPPGDVNGDGLANTKDIFVLINRIFGGGGVTAGNADVNHDSSLNSADVDYLASYYFGAGPAPQ